MSKLYVQLFYFEGKIIWKKKKKILSRYTIKKKNEKKNRKKLSDTQ